MSVLPEPLDVPPVLGADLEAEYERLRLQPPLREEGHFPYLCATDYYQQIKPVRSVDHGLPYTIDGAWRGMVVTNHYVQVYSQASLDVRNAMIAEALNTPTPWTGTDIPTTSETVVTTLSSMSLSDDDARYATLSTNGFTFCPQDPWVVHGLERHPEYNGKVAIMIRIAGANHRGRIQMQLLSTGEMLGIKPYNLAPITAETWLQLEREDRDALVRRSQAKGYAQGVLVANDVVLDVELDAGTTGVVCGVPVNEHPVRGVLAVNTVAVDGDGAAWETEKNKEPPPGMVFLWNIPPSDARVGQRFSTIAATGDEWSWIVPDDWTPGMKLRIAIPKDKYEAGVFAMGDLAATLREE